MLPFASTVCLSIVIPRAFDQTKRPPKSGLLRTGHTGRQQSKVSAPLLCDLAEQKRIHLSRGSIKTETSKEVIQMDFKLSINESKMLSSHISRLCKAVGKEKAQIYARYADLINLAPNLKDNQEESDDEDDFADEEHRGRDEPRDGHRAKDDALKDDFRDSFKDDLKEPAAGDHLKESSSRNGEESKNERRDEKKFTTQDRCFMQTFQAASLAEPAPDRSLSNYERLKLKLRLQQMMAKPAEKLNKNESKNIQFEIRHAIELNPEEFK
ncbi:hypothetical protein L1887_62306 [Cichorium endivia]|nr:hypothetical protein L1887_62306 [Cichorium endivia]